MQPTKPGRPWRRVAVTGAAALAVLGGLAVYVYVAVGDLGLSVNGYIALVAGAVGTAVVAVGLMSLLFFSDRQGYDDAAAKPPGRQKPPAPNGGNQTFLNKAK
jgi:hypothetical protein